ncbi:hypothetical protein CVIRNUC_004694 [Coccomyxa viridis]|uniref:Spindle assembly abnormal protein 6 N-terminal domain-containing protein n=1 Tax=Coccomyxa viridis TaxID=1274662 RepID=A0AAV1I6G0_9CHLO|nr:hypothetical protein CVIRNUC_004694 [Coccomyxa viridis]
MAQIAHSSGPSQLTTVFWKAVGSLCRRPGREEQQCDLTIRILQGADRLGGSTRVLVIQIWSEQDLSSLHTLEVREDDFQALKLDQGILVDFGGFPAKIITLLQRCLASSREDPPRFQAILSIQEGVSVFKVVETNDFNQLPHITLAFRPGNDATVKAFLAGRLSEVQAVQTALERDLSRAQAEASSKGEQLHAVQQALSEATAAHERYVIEAEAKAKSEAAEAVRLKSHELMQQKEALDRQREAMEEQLKGAMERLQSRAGSLSEERLQLQEAKFGTDAALLDASHRAAAAEGALSSLEAECEALRQRCAAAAAERAQSAADCAELRSRLLSAEEKLAAQKEVAAEQAQHARGLEGALRQLEERCAELKQASAGHEERGREAAAETAKAARAVEKLTAELHLAKERLRRKSAVLARQEEEIAARGKALDTAAVDAQALQHAANRAQQDAEARQADCVDLREKLEEAKKQQHSQEDMIRWLNKQVRSAGFLEFKAVCATWRCGHRPHAQL